MISSNDTIFNRSNGWKRTHFATTWKPERKTYEIPDTEKGNLKTNFPVRAAEALAVLRGPFFAADPLHGLEPGADAREGGRPAPGGEADLGPLESGLADAAEVVDPAVVVIVKRAGHIAILLADVLHVDGHLQLILRGKIPAGLVIHDDDAAVLLGD